MPRPGMMLGRLAPKPHAKTLSFAKYLKATAPPPPPEKAFYEYHIGGTAWGMLGNDTVGDCTCADAGHRVELWTSQFGSPAIITTEDALAVYSAVTGYVPGDPSTDNGAAMTDVFAYCQSTGIAGHKIDGWAAVDFTNLTAVRQAIYLFGHLSIGVNLPNSALDQTKAHQPWDVVADDGGIDGGHDVPIFGYGADGFTAVSWGQLQQLGIPWFNTYVEEAYSAISLDWLDKNGNAPNSLNLDALVTDLNALKA